MESFSVCVASFAQHLFRTSCLLQLAIICLLIIQYEYILLHGYIIFFFFGGHVGRFQSGANMNGLLLTF